MREASDHEDQALRALFEHLRGVENGGFTERVMARVQRQRLLRRMILATAIGIGLAVSLAPAATTLVAMSVELAGLMGQWIPSDWISPPLVLAALAVTALFLPGVVRMLEE